MAQFEIALKLKPDDFLSHDGLAEVLWRQGKFREAVEHLKQEWPCNRRTRRWSLKSCGN